MAGRERSLSDVLKRGYSDDELAHIFALGRFHLENGAYPRALNVMRGLVTVAPEFVPAWLGLAYIHLMNGNSETALSAAREAYKLQPSSPLVVLYLITALLSMGDVAAAGAYLGEVGESIEQGESSPDLVRYYRMQLARYKNLA